MANNIVEMMKRPYRLVLYIRGADETLISNMLTGSLGASDMLSTVNNGVNSTSTFCYFTEREVTSKIPLLQFNSKIIHAVIEDFRLAPAEIVRREFNFSRKE